MRSLAVLLVVGLAVYRAASCTAPPAVQPALGDWWANRRAAFAGDRPEPPAGLFVSSWTVVGFSIAWWPAPTILPAPPVDRWEIRIARGPWIPVDVRRPSFSRTGVMYAYIEVPPPEDGTLLSVRGVNGAGPGQVASFRSVLPR